MKKYHEINISYFLFWCFVESVNMDRYFKLLGKYFIITLKLILCTVVRVTAHSKSHKIVDPGTGQEEVYIYI